ncbi:conserved hypothetical protein [Rippkaea orientalis PCC 8801]|uniref:Uncharacterized protein n=1 Tax=Rippkaea orientalis (strain PCC 8801 / RF-1) TaxID=41431 RepID=B7JVZ1_RIPO1|nr:Npun_F0494 family protein [Rippkaea orientalis]ACK65680.1 conserved hypothetical protein [Rippkaea orientalis PCC 8801]
MTTTTQPVKPSDLTYSHQTLKRAERALACTSFKLPLFIAMKTDSVPLPNIAHKTGMERGYTQKPLSEQKTERDLMWLISVGILRREVDGQGITDSFRLTPLGRQIIGKWEDIGSELPHPSWWDRLVNTLTRWLRLPLL